MTNIPAGDAVTDVQQYYVEAFRHLDPVRTVPPITVEFYPYVNINHTIRVRSGRVFVRIAEMCRDMPSGPQRALAYILVAKLLRRKVPAQASEIYGNYIKTAEMRERAAESKKTRGRKIITSPLGSIYDLNEVFDRLNSLYFHGKLPKPVLTWSAGKTYRILGHHDATHETVVISRSLDSAEVPRYVVDFVMFHEMLHIHHPAVHHNGRRYHHTAAFRKDEKKFAHYEAAERWIERNVGRLKRQKRRR